MTHLYDAEGYCVPCHGCHRLARWRRLDVGSVVYLCACGTAASRALAVATEAVRVGRLEPLVDDWTPPTYDEPEAQVGCF